MESVNAVLSIVGDGVRPEKITEMLGIEPDQSWAKGDEYIGVIGKTRSRHSGLWEFTSSGKVTSAKPLNHLKYIIRMFRNKQHGFDRIKLNSDVRIDVVITWAVSHGNYEIPSKQLKEIVDLGVDGTYHVFIGVDDEPDEDPCLPEDVACCLVLHNQTEGRLFVELNQGVVRMADPGKYARATLPRTPSSILMGLHFPGLTPRRDDCYEIDLPPCVIIDIHAIVKADFTVVATCVGHSPSGKLIVEDELLLKNNSSKKQCF
jgi:hypothetical protein